MKTRYRELYSSFLRLDKLKKMTTIKNNDQISSDQKKEIQDEARRVRLLLKEYDSLWMEQGWSSARKSSGLSRKTPPAKEAQRTSTLTSDPVKNPRPTKTKSRKSHTDVGNSDDIPLLSTTTATADKSHMTATMCAQSAKPTNMWLQMLQGHKKEGRNLTMRNRSTMTSRPGG